MKQFIASIELSNPIELEKYELFQESLNMRKDAMFSATFENSRQILLHKLV